MSSRSLVFLVAYLLMMSCRSSRHADGSTPSPEAQKIAVKVDNQVFLDMTIYVLDGAQRVRLDVAPGHTVTMLFVPSYLVRSSAPLRFLCDPIGSNRAPVSDEIVVQPGDVVTLVIPPN